jgi:cation diffusion facilitator CzcD-associated flavoprotein CzcO
MDTHDVVIVGAGPYGLSAAAHLRHATGLDVRVFGKPMSFWERHMPAGMLLRSLASASDIADPDNRLSIAAYERLNGHQDVNEPVAARDFIRYGHWFHHEAAVAADHRSVVRIELSQKGYRLTLDQGETVGARRLVLAAGIQPFAHRPAIFNGLPCSLVSHSSEQRDYAQFRHKEVLVIGGGQSALEAAASLHEVGADVEILIRKAALHHDKSVSSRLKTNRWLRLLYGQGDVGPAGISLIIQRPSVFRRLPRAVQYAWDRRAIRPRFSYQHVRGMPDIRVHVRRFVVQARPRFERLRVHLNDGAERTVDHVVLGTGYRVDVARYEFFSPEVLERIRLVDGYPRLDSGFESSLPGLHFLGAPAAWSFGPLVRFVAGTGFTSRALRRRILRENGLQASMNGM